MLTCPYGHRPDQQVKVGCNPSGSQRYWRKVCQRKYTPKPHTQGYSAALRRRAVQM